MLFSFVVIYGFSLFILGWIIGYLLLRSNPWMTSLSSFTMTRKEVKRIMATLEELLAVASAIPTKVDSLISILEGIKQQLADALAQVGEITPEMQAKIDEIFSNAVASATKIQGAIDANTPT